MGVIRCLNSLTFCVICSAVTILLKLVFPPSRLRISVSLKCRQHIDTNDWKIHFSEH